MRGILADVNIGAQRDALLTIWTSNVWHDVWNELGLSVLSFPTLGLSFDAPDALIWRTCQSEELVLITANRNSAVRTRWKL